MGGTTAEPTKFVNPVSENFDDEQSDSPPSARSRAVPEKVRQAGRGVWVADTEEHVRRKHPWLARLVPFTAAACASPFTHRRGRRWTSQKIFDLHELGHKAGHAAHAALSKDGLSRMSQSTRHIADAAVHAGVHAVDKTMHAPVSSTKDLVQGAVHLGHGALDATGDVVRATEKTAKQAGKKITEARRTATDPYVAVYLGAVRGRSIARTASVVGSSVNNNGRDPLWTPEQCQTPKGSPTNTIIYVLPGPDDEYVTFEVMDSDLGMDDLLGGRTLHVAEMVKLIKKKGVERHRMMNIQLFDRRDRFNPNIGFRYGHDGGLLRLRATLEDGHGLGGDLIRLEIQGAVDLLPDTPAIRDLRTFSDWHQTGRLMLFMVCYLFIGTAVFGFFFGEFACAGERASLCTEGEGGPPGNVTRAKVDADYASSLVYFTSSNSRHPSPHLDGIVFMISSITTVGWGSQPMDFMDAPEGKESVFLLMKLFLVVTLLVGITWLGLLIGSMGQAFRAFFRAHHMMMYETVISNTPLVKSGDDGEKPLFDEKASIRCGRIGGTTLAYFSMLVVIGLGAAVFSFTESDDGQELSFVDALYVTVVSITTVGYGDIAPSSTASKIFSIFYIPIGVAFVANAMDYIAGSSKVARDLILEEFVLGQFGQVGSLDDNKLSPFDFEELQRSVSGRLSVINGETLTRNDFRLAMLLRLGRVDPNELDVIDRVFEKMDSNDSGGLTQKEIIGEHDNAMVKRIDRLNALWEEAGQRQGRKLRMDDITHEEDLQDDMQHLPLE
jgi:hypothetical protein